MSAPEDHNVAWLHCPACNKQQTHGAVCDDCYRAGKRTPPLSVDPGFLWREWTK